MKHPMKLKALALSMILTSTSAIAGEAGEIEYEIEFKNNQFAPTELVVPADRKFELEVENEGSEEIVLSIAELGIEIAVPAGAEREAYLGPLEPGDYEFEDSLNSSRKGILRVQ